MARSAEDDWPENQRVAPDASRSNELLHRARMEAQSQVFAGLRVMDAELIAEPVPDRRLGLIQEFEATRASRHGR
ncbi:hypothetical protein [Microvirga massiliensis]|uniref:hypothetical protein n=1 Tax=Microvirga massiliensis TaxID=1033741 RepID=UPI00062B56D4|nr:hypothetical protein [Microvirga massiliensis]